MYNYIISTHHIQTFEDIKQTIISRTSVLYAQNSGQFTKLAWVMQREAQDIFTFFLQRVNWSKVFVRNFKRNASKFDFHVNFTLSFGLKTHLTLNVTNQDKSLSSCRRPNTALLWWKQEIHQAPPLFFFFLKICSNEYSCEKIAILFFRP